MTSRIVVSGGTALTNNGPVVADVAVEEGKVVEIGTSLDTVGCRVVDASHCFVVPGFVDLHTHLREPGREEAETVETGSRAAAMGGYTAVVAMPNTEPTIDSASVVRQVQQAASRALCDVMVAGSITVGRAGKELSPMAELAALGVTMFTDDGSGVQDSRLMLRAIQQASSLGVTLAQHCEDESLSAGGHMHEGAVSSRLGIPAIAAEAEELMVMRDIALARRTGVRIHLMHLSTARSVAMVRAAKDAGISITAEACPHHFTLTDEEVASLDPVFKVNPPLRSRSDVEAVKQGLRDGVIDAIATDHAPHAEALKQLAFEAAPCGMLNLETAFGLAVTELGLPIERLVELMSTNPASIAGLDAEHGTLAIGRSANLAVVDVGATWEVDPALFASKSRNTPYASRKLQGRVKHTLLRGEPVVLDGKAQR